MTDLARHYHLSGIAGAGMSALAEALVHRGYTVTGSDRDYDQARNLDLLAKLSRMDVQLASQDGSGLDPETTGLVVSTAIESDNPDLVAARALGIPILHRAELLADLCRGQRCIAITGTSGKTTITGMVGWILNALGYAPHVVNGGAIRNWVGYRSLGSAKAGNSDLWVVEADESDKSLLHFKPEWAIISNISKDHFELAETRALFRAFARGVKRGIVCGPGVATQLGEMDIQARLYEERFAVEKGDRNRFIYKGMTFELPLLGRHNAENAFLATALAERLGCDLEAIREALQTFKGISRRLEVVGNTTGITVIDDYGHNPAKIRAAWTTVASVSRRVLGVWRPHGFAALALMMSELADCFSAVMRPGDTLYLLPVYYVGGSTTKSVHSQDLADILRARNLSVELTPDYERLGARLMDTAQPGDTILCMGARDPELPLFSRRLLERIQETKTFRH